MIHNSLELAIPFGKNTYIIVHKSGSKYGIKVHNTYQWEDKSKIVPAEMEEGLKTELLNVATKVAERLTPLYESAAGVFGEEFVGIESRYNTTLSLSKSALENGSWIRLEGGYLYLLAHMPEVEILNEYKLSTTARDLCIRVEIVDMHVNGDYKFTHFQGLRYTLSLREAGGGYSHSHLPGVTGFFNHFCLGSSELAYKMNTRVKKATLDYVVALMFAMAGTESIAGSPYRRLDDMLNVERSLSRIASGHRRGNAFPTPGTGHIGEILRDAFAAGKRFPLEVNTTGDFGGGVQLGPGAQSEIRAIVEEFAPDSLKVSPQATVSGLTESSVRAHLPSVEQVPPKGRKIFNGVTYDRVNIKMDSKEEEILVAVDPKAKKGAAKRMLPDQTKQWLVTNTQEIIKNRLEHEPRWNI